MNTSCVPPPDDGLDPENVATLPNVLAGPVTPPPVATEPLAELGRADPASAERLRRAMHQLPGVGDWFVGFKLVAVLGRGAFGRVYLARQGELADRFVALKVSTDLTGESRTLARLQHTNIVPIYSVHRLVPFQAVCMPYFGSTTLAHLLAHYRDIHSLPADGRQLVDTLCVLNDQTGASTATFGGTSRGSGAVGHGSGARPGTEPEARSEQLPPRNTAQGVLGLLRAMSYTDAVCWVGEQLAEGLAHAHAQGVVHNDLKPANVLLTDEGRPMLLDFGVAEEFAARAAAPVARIGGTLPYMAPEHLESIESGTPATDPRSDIYGLGLILFEMLTGRHPFTCPTGDTEAEVPRMLTERRAGPPRVRAVNPAVSPGLEAIVRKCLEPNPARRYQSAADLRDDLERHRTGRPLRHVRVPSVRERLTKWVRRHPRLTSNLTLVTVAVFLVSLCAAGLYARGVRLERYEAAEASRGLDDDLKIARYLFSARPADPQAIGTGVSHCEAALARYGLPGDDAWERRPIFRALAADEQQRVRVQLTEACVFLARGYALRARSGDGESELLGRAVELNVLAERIAGPVPRAVWEQRARLLRRLGRAEEAARFADLGRNVTPHTGRDYYLCGWDALAEGQNQVARDLLARSVELDPGVFWAHMALGVANENLGKYPAAAGCYDTAIALQPDVSWGHYNRGLVALRMRDYEKARSALDRSAALAPEYAETYLNRALAAQGLRDYTAALQDLERALAAGAPKARAAFMRARVRELSGDKAAAKRELDEAMKLEPTDELTWLARGSARLNGDLPGALADFDAALAVNPRSLAALQNKSHVLGRLGRTDEAIRALDRLLELYPEYVPARAGRGVLYARLGEWEAARADADEALRRDRGPANVFQVAGIHALLSKHDPSHQAEAIRLVTTALRGGFGYEYVETDKDLDPLRTTTEFRRIVEGVRALNLQPAGRQ